MAEQLCGRSVYPINAFTEIEQYSMPLSNVGGGSLRTRESRIALWFGRNIM